MTLPDYNSLARMEDGSPSAWYLFGADDNVGLVNLQTPERVARAAALARQGKVFPLDLPAGFISPAMYGREVPRRGVKELQGGWFLDDWLDGFYPQAGSQWDSLAHAAYKPGQFYNGATKEQCLAGERNTVEHWARRGIVGRGVVLDVQRALADEGRPFDPASSYGITAADLELARRRSGAELEPGDILIIRTGYLEWYTGLDAARRADLGRPDHQHVNAGLAHSEDLARYVWDSHCSAIVSDNPGVEANPPDFRPESWPFGHLHSVLIGLFGLAMGEFFALDALAADCAEDGAYECFFVAAPMNQPGMVGSAANAVAIK